MIFANNIGTHLPGDLRATNFRGQGIGSVRSVASVVKMTAEPRFMRHGSTHNGAGGVSMAPAPGRAKTMALG